MPRGTPDLDVRSISNSRHRSVRVKNRARCWDSKAPTTIAPRANVELVEAWTQVQINANTTWDITLQGIRQPLSNKQRQGTVYLPMNYYLEPGEQVHVRQPYLQKALTTLHQLEAAAALGGLTSWRKLHKSLLPAIWYSHARPSKYDEGGGKAEKDTKVIAPSTAGRGTALTRCSNQNLSARDTAQRKTARASTTSSVVTAVVRGAEPVSRATRKRKLEEITEEEDVESPSDKSQPSDPDDEDFKTPRERKRHRSGKAKKVSCRGLTRGTLSASNRKNDKKLTSQEEDLENDFVCKNPPHDFDTLKRSERQNTDSQPPSPHHETQNVLTTAPVVMDENALAEGRRTQIEMRARYTATLREIHARRHATGQHNPPQQHLPEQSSYRQPSSYLQQPSYPQHPHQPSSSNSNIYEHLAPPQPTYFQPAYQVEYTQNPYQAYPTATNMSSSSSAYQPTRQSQNNNFPPNRAANPAQAPFNMDIPQPSTPYVDLRTPYQRMQDEYAATRHLPAPRPLPSDRALLAQEAADYTAYVQGVQQREAQRAAYAGAPHYPPPPHQHQTVAVPYTRAGEYAPGPLEPSGTVMVAVPAHLPPPLLYYTSPEPSFSVPSAPIPAAWSQAAMQPPPPPPPPAAAAAAFQPTAWSHAATLPPPPPFEPAAWSPAATPPPPPPFHPGYTGDVFFGAQEQEQEQEQIRDGPNPVAPRAREETTEPEEPDLAAWIDFTGLVEENETS